MPALPLRVFLRNTSAGVLPNGLTLPGGVVGGRSALRRASDGARAPCRLRGLAVPIGLMVASGTLAAATPETEFLKANTAVMDRMMTGMAAKRTGQVDADFVNMMVPHHQGAIEMAELELRYGRNEQLRRIAQAIIVEQQQEIAAMRLALGRTQAPSGSTPPGSDAAAVEAPGADASRGPATPPVEQAR